MSNMEKTLPQTTRKSAQTLNKESKLMDLWAMCGLTLTCIYCYVYLHTQYAMFIFYVFIYWLLNEETNHRQKNTLWLILLLRATTIFLLIPWAWESHNSLSTKLFEWWNCTIFSQSAVKIMIINGSVLEHEQWTR